MIFLGSRVEIVNSMTQKDTKMKKKDGIESLRGIVRRQVRQHLQELAGPEEKAVSIEKKVQAIVKVAGQGLKAVKLLKSLPDPTQKVQSAVEASVVQLEHIFNSMLQSPMDYLDENPQATLDAYKQSLDSRQSSLTDNAATTTTPTTPQGQPY